MLNTHAFFAALEVIIVNRPRLEVICGGRHANRVSSLLIESNALFRKLLFAQCIGILIFREPLLRAGIALDVRAKFKLLAKMPFGRRAQHFHLD
eukprot:3103574-Pleurochrysis_carterae.AAC.1